MACCAAVVVGESAAGEVGLCCAGDVGLVGLCTGVVVGVGVVVGAAVVGETGEVVAEVSAA